MNLPLKICVAFFAYLLLGNACANNRPPITTALKVGVLEVQVKNYQDNPVDRAIVTIKSSSLASPLVYRTDASGQLRVTLPVSLAPLSVEVTKRDFNTMVRFGLPLSTAKATVVAYRIERNATIKQLMKTTIK